MPEESRSRIPVLLGTVRAGRRSAHVAGLIFGELETRDGIDTELIDLADLQIPLMRHRLGETDSPPPGASELSTKLTRVDGLLLVVPEYKSSYPGSLKNALDYLEAGILKRKPVGIITVSSGAFGGLNCLAQLRLVCLAMGGVPIPVTFPVPRVDDAFDEQGGLRDPKLAGRAASFVDELIWYARALAGPHDRGG
jgi:NAD(P)H-dependent FMN reductase